MRKRILLVPALVAIMLATTAGAAFAPFETTLSGTFSVGGCTTQYTFSGVFLLPEYWLGTSASATTTAPWYTYFTYTQLNLSIWNGGKTNSALGTIYIPIYGGTDSKTIYCYAPHAGAADGSGSVSTETLNLAFFYSSHRVEVAIEGRPPTVDIWKTYEGP